MRITSLLMVVALLGLFGQGCGSERECVELCQEGQAGQCTSIKGDCSAFCSALEAVKGRASCVSQADSYTDCLNGESNVCDVSCGAQETAMSTCVGLYCALHLTEAECKTLMASF